MQNQFIFILQDVKQTTIHVPLMSMFSSHSQKTFIYLQCVILFKAL